MLIAVSSMLDAGAGTGTELPSASGEGADIDEQQRKDGEQLCGRPSMLSSENKDHNQVERHSNVGGGQRWWRFRRKDFAKQIPSFVNAQPRQSRLTTSGLFENANNLRSDLHLDPF